MKKRARQKKIIQGGILSAVLAVAAGIFLISKPGKKLRKDIKKHAGAFYKHLSPQLRKVRNMGVREFKTLVNTELKKYSKMHKLTRAEEKAILLEMQKTWKQLKKHLT